MRLLLGFFLLWMPARAESPTYMYAPRSLPVYQGPGEEYKKLFFLSRRERVLVLGEEGNYTKVKVKRSGRVISGYVLSAELEEHLAPEGLPDEGFAMGFGPVYSSLSQNGKSFSNEDEVKYTTSKYASRSVSPFVFLQFSRWDFYRIFFGYRLTHFKGSATKDITGAPSQSVDLQHQMVAFGFQKAWNPLHFFKPLYLGFGAEAARGVTMQVQVDGAQLPVQSRDLPLYLGLHGLAGLQVFFGKKLSLAAEAHAGSYLNQSVPVFAIEATGMVLWWF